MDSTDGTVTLDSYKGRIDVETWDRNRVRVSVTIEGEDPRERMEEMMGGGGPPGMGGGGQGADRLVQTRAEGEQQGVVGDQHPALAPGEALVGVGFYLLASRVVGRGRVRRGASRRDARRRRGIRAPPPKCRGRGSPRARRAPGWR